MDFSLGAIWAQTIDGVVGDGKNMPWHIPADLRFFQEQTLGHDVLMGASTWHSLPPAYRPLPRRKNFVLSSDPAGQWSEGAQVCSNLDAALDAMSRPAWIIGGGKTYAACLDKVDYVVRTLINVELADQLPHAVFAPQLGDDFELVTETEWQEVPGAIQTSIVRTADTVEIKVQRFRRH